MRLPKIPFMGKPEEQVHAPTQEQTKPDALVSFLENCFRVGEQARMPYETPALLSLLFWAGNQWCSVEQDITRAYNRRIFSPKDTSKVRIVNNRLIISTRAVIATMSENLPVLQAVPATFDQDDVDAAELATLFLKYRDRLDREDELREAELLWLFGTGEVARRVWWDPSAGRPGKKEGDMRTEVVNFFRYVKDPQSVEAPHWVIEYDARDCDEVEAMYGVTVDPEDVADKMRFLDRLALNVMNGAEQVRTTAKNSCVLKRMYVKPTEQYPNGQVFVWANGKLLKQHEFQAGHFPFVFSGWFPVPGRLYPISFIEPLVSDQRRLNIILSQMQEVINRQIRGDAVWSGPAKPTFETGKDGQRNIYMPPGSNWHFMQYDLKTQDANSMVERILSDIKEKAGTNDPSLGKVSDKEVTAFQINVLKESDFSNVAFHTQRYSRGLCEIDMCKLALAREYYKNQRMIGAVGSRGAQSINAFRGSDLRDTRDVIAVPTPRMTPAMRQQVMVDAVSNGLLGPYESPEHEYAARLQLVAMGLEEYDEKQAEITGTMDDLAEMVRTLRTAKYAALLMEAEQILNPQPPPVPMDAGVPAEAGGEMDMPLPPGVDPGMVEAAMAEQEMAAGGTM